MHHLSKGEGVSGRGRSRVSGPAYRRSQPDSGELAKWVVESGLELRKFFNTSGLKYKALALKEKLPAMSDAEKLALLASDGMLVKRPLLIGGGKVLVGFKPAEWEAALK